jgi:hypothetical protein
MGLGVHEHVEACRGDAIMSGKNLNSRVWLALVYQLGTMGPSLTLLSLSDLFHEMGRNDSVVFSNLPWDCEQTLSVQVACLVALGYRLDPPWLRDLLRDTEAQQYCQLTVFAHLPEVLLGSGDRH